MTLAIRVKSLWREQQGSNVAQAAAVALAAALLITALVMGSQNLGPAVGRAVSCLAAAISGGGGCSVGAAAQAQAGGAPAAGRADNGPSGGRTALSVALDFTPFLGEAKGLIEVFTGTDLVTGEDLGWWRFAGLAGLVGFNEIKHLRHADDAVQAIGGVGRRADELDNGATAGRRLNPCPIGATPGKGRGLAAPLLGCGRPVDPELLAELGQRGIKHTPENIVAIARDPSGRVVFLETGKGGKGGAGLAHVLEEHADDFARRGISQDQIPDAVMTAVTEGKIVGYQGRSTGRPIYEFTFNGETHYVAVSVGSNGFVVGANPATRP
jgi:hypothetical protein